MRGRCCQCLQQVPVTEEYCRKSEEVWGVGGEWQTGGGLHQVPALASVWKQELLPAVSAPLWLLGSSFLLSQQPDRGSTLTCFTFGPQRPPPSVVKHISPLVSSGSTGPLGEHFFECSSSLRIESIQSTSVSPSLHRKICPVWGQRKLLCLPSWPENIAGY